MSRKKFNYLNPRYLERDLVVDVPVRKSKSGVEYEFLFECPFCGVKHLHGVGGGEGGHRVPHCIDPVWKLNDALNRSYKLIPIGSDSPAG